MLLTICFGKSNRAWQGNGDPSGFLGMFQVNLRARGLVNIEATLLQRAQHLFGLDAGELRRHSLNRYYQLFGHGLRSCEWIFRNLLSVF